VTSPLMAAAWVETVMRAELCNSMEAVDSRQQFEQTSLRFGHTVGSRNLLDPKTVRPEAASSSDTDHIHKLQQTDIHRHCCPTMYQAVRMLSNSTDKYGDNTQVISKDTTATSRCIALCTFEIKTTFNAYDKQTLDTITRLHKSRNTYFTIIVLHHNN